MPDSTTVPNPKLLVDDKMMPLSPGMMASVEIKTGSRTMMEYVLSPVMKAAKEAGRERDRSRKCREENPIETGEACPGDLRCSYDPIANMVRRSPQLDVTEEDGSHH